MSLSESTISQLQTLKDTGDMAISVLQAAIVVTIFCTMILF